MKVYNIACAPCPEHLALSHTEREHAVHRPAMHNAMHNEMHNAMYARKPKFMIQAAKQKAFDHANGNMI